MAKTALRVKQARKPKFAVRAYTRCQRVRPTQGGLPQVRPVPDLLARNGAQGRAARHHEIVVVMMAFAALQLIPDNRPAFAGYGRGPGPSTSGNQR